jgi:hypothetical protein
MLGDRYNLKNTLLQVAMNTNEISDRANQLDQDDAEEEALLATYAQLREEINGYVYQLSVERLRTVIDFMAYLADQESQEATDELLAIPGFAEAFEKAKKNATEGKLLDWKKVRSDV